MDVGARITAHLRASRALYEAGAIGLPEMRARVSRAALLVERDRYLRAGPPRGTARDAEALACLARLSDAVASGRRVVAIDVGAGEALGVEEVGICTLAGGEATTLTLFDGRARHRDPAGGHGRPHRPALFGETRAAARDELLSAAREAYASADVAIFHSAHADLHRLGLEHDPGASSTPSHARGCGTRGLRPSPTSAAVTGSTPPGRTTPGTTRATPWTPPSQWRATAACPRSPSATASASPATRPAGG